MTTIELIRNVAVKGHGYEAGTLLAVPIDLTGQEAQQLVDMNRAVYATAKTVLASGDMGSVYDQTGGTGAEDSIDLTGTAGADALGAGADSTTLPPTGPVTQPPVTTPPKPPNNRARSNVAQ